MLNLYHGLPLGGQSLPLKGVMLVVTYDGLFAYSLVIIGVISVCVAIYRKK